MHFFEFWTIIDYALYVIKLSMKKLFVQLWQWILKRKKKLIYGALALFIGQICFFNLWWIGVENIVYAADETTQENNIQRTLTDIKEKSDLFHKLVYLFMYPVLFIAWKLVDNSLVYWEAFGFDTVLWELWVIVRNIANFGLGFIFIFKIFQFLINEKKAGKIKDILISTLIAWVGIQASWFIMAAFIDISTIVAYGVWWLPLSVLKTDVKNSADEQKYKDSLEYNPYILWSALYVDVNDIDSYSMYLTNGTSSWDPKFISQCETFVCSYTVPVFDGTDFKNVEKPDEELILWPKMVYYYDGVKNEYYPTEKNKCHLNWHVYYFNGLYELLEWPAISNKSLSEQERKDAQNTYALSMATSLTFLKLDKLIDEDIKKWSILQIWDAHAWKVWSQELIQYWKDQKMGLDVNNKWIGEEWELPRLSAVSTTGGYVWVFSSLYSSLMYAGMDLGFKTHWLYEELLSSFLSLWHMLAISIPLIVMLVVFMVRIGILWMAIVLSPLIILLKAFGFDKSKFMKEWILTYLSVENLVPIIFSPAIICFAVSMSTVLVRIINNLNWNKGGANDDLSSFLWWLIKLDISGISVGIWKIVCSVICIAITWFLVWTAVKSSVPKGSGLWQRLEKLQKDTEGLLWSIPIVPVPWKDTMLWVNTVFGWRGQEWIISRMWNDIKSKYDWKNNEAVRNLINPTSEEEASKRANEYRVKTYINWLVGLSVIPEDWQTKYSVDTVDSKNNTITTTFANLDAWEQKNVIEKINDIKDVNKRIAFGQCEEITIDGKKYKFNSSSNKFESDG